MARGVLTIETGLRCNNHCDFCPQRAMRDVAGSAAELTTAEVLERLARGREEGHDEVAFTGGEPTIRPDFSSLVAEARRLGYREVSVSTNGRMFWYRGRVREWLDAGLTGVSVSLHGPDAGTHDRLCGTPHAFEQAVRGIETALRTAAETGRVLHVNTVTLIVPATAPRLRETLTLAGSLGVRLHIVQPFIASRETLPVAREYLMSLPQIRSAIEQAVRGGLPHPGRIKPYNIPPCVVEHLGDVIEPQTYRLRTLREFERDGRRTPPPGRQFYREPRCEDCRYLCPGFRIEHRPSDQTVAAILASAAETPSISRGEATLACLDLLDEGALKAVLSGVRRIGARRVRVLWGGVGLASTESLIRVCRETGVEEVALVAVPECRRRMDHRVVLPGNLDRLVEDLQQFQPDRPPRPSLFVALHEVLDPSCRFGVAGLDSLVGSVLAGGGRDLYLVASDFPTPYDPPYDDAFRGQVVREGIRIATTLRDRGLRVHLLETGSRVQDALAEHLGLESWDDHLVRHPLLAEDTGFVMWSRPSWLLAARTR